MSIAPEKIQVACPSCAKILKVSSSTAGKQGRCPACKHVFLIQAPPGPDLELLPDLAPMDEDDLPQLASDPFAAATGSSYTLPSAADTAYQPQTDSSFAQHTLANQYLANAAASMQPASPPQEAGDGWGINAGIGGGVLLMLGAVLWFVLGIILLDRIFFYPPIMFIIGIIAFGRGLMRTAGG
jgi:hypothetical protein